MTDAFAAAHPPEGVLADFRSDTVTRPTSAMLQAMVAAPVGDDVFGDDPTVRALEDEVADLLGAEAALFVASGTMSNMLALRTHVGPLEEVLCDQRAHVHVWEVGGIHTLAGASVAAVAPEEGERFLCGRSVAAYARLDNTLYHQPVTKLLSLENTLNGEVVPLRTLADATGAARERGVATHLDGARLWNAAEVPAGADGDGGAPLREYGALFDSVSVCLSKGLGAPAGSVLVGGAARLDRARHFRKLHGGAMRQAGLLAACGLHALREHRERLAEDHANAAELAAGLEELGFDVAPPQTNMVWCSPPPAEAGAPSFEEIAHSLATEERILVGGAYGGPRGRNPWGQARTIRFVVHLQTPRPAVQALLGGIRRCLTRGR